jgi:hypothetical protein
MSRSFSCVLERAAVVTFFCHVQYIDLYINDKRFMTWTKVIGFEKWRAGSNSHHPNISAAQLFYCMCLFSIPSHPHPWFEPYVQGDIFKNSEMLHYRRWKKYKKSFLIWCCYWAIFYSDMRLLLLLLYTYIILFFFSFFQLIERRCSLYISSDLRSSSSSGAQSIINNSGPTPKPSGVDITDESKSPALIK